MAQLKCPNCGADVIAGKDQRMICTKCGGSFAWQEGDVKLVGVGEYEKLAGVVEQNAKDIEQLKAALPKPVEPAAAEEPPTGDEEDDDL
jgi:hypothetical protein